MELVAFVRKASNIDQVKGLFGETPFVVEKVIELSFELYNYFSCNLLEDFYFIKENTDKMFVDCNGIWHCIMVQTEYKKEAILIQSEGYNYSRYTAYIGK